MYRILGAAAGPATDCKDAGDPTHVRANDAARPASGASPPALTLAAADCVATLVAYSKASADKSSASDVAAGAGVGGGGVGVAASYAAHGRNGGAGCEASRSPLSIDRLLLACSAFG